MKKTLKFIWRLLYYIQLTLFITAVLSLVYLLIYTDHAVSLLANYVVEEPSEEPSDVIVVIGGDDGHLRVQHGLELLKNGYGKKIVFSGVGGSEEQKTMKLLEEQGVNSKQYLFESTAKTTFENADNLVGFAKDNDIKSILLVCSNLQSRRASFVFDKVFKEADIYTTYSEKSTYNPDLIFDNKDMRERLANESMKLLYYYFKYLLY